MKEIKQFPFNTNQISFFVACFFKPDYLFVFAGFGITR